MKVTFAALTLELAARKWFPPKPSVVPAAPVKVLPLLATPPPMKSRLPLWRSTTPVPTPLLVLLKALPMVVVSVPTDFR